MLDELLQMPIDNDTSHLSCVLTFCEPLMLLALFRCSSTLRKAVAVTLQKAEETSKKTLEICLGATLEYLSTSTQTIIAVREPLPSAQAHHLGVLLQEGNRLQGITRLTLCQHFHQLHLRSDTFTLHQNTLVLPILIVFLKQNRPTNLYWSSARILHVSVMTTL